MGIVYSDVLRFGLCGILPHKKRYGTAKDIHIVTNAIKENHDFCQFALSHAPDAICINDIIGNLIKYVIFCNEIFYDEE